MCTKWFDLAERFIKPKWKIKNNIDNRLQKHEFTKDFILKLKFTKTLYKTIDEILNQSNKTYCEKFEEWFEIEKEHKWLIDLKLDWWLWLNELRKEEWYNKTIEEEREEICKELLMITKASFEWKTRMEIKFL